MSFDAYPVKANEPETKMHIVTYQGAGAAAMTVDNGGRGMTLTQDATGVFTITWASNPGNFLGWNYALGAATPTDVDGFTVTREAYNTSTYTLQFNIYTEGESAHDLSTSEFMDVQVYFQSTGA
jgi:hypothetical protein